MKQKFKSKNRESSAYISPAWQQHADLVVHLSQFSQNILLVIAPEQGGKSTFMAHLTQMSLPTLKRISITASAEDTMDSLMEKVANGFECAWDGMDPLIKQVQTTVDKACAERCSVALLVDDAHLLTDQQIAALVQLISKEAESDRQLHLVLLGEPSLELRLFSNDWNESLQGRVYTIELESWTLDDIQAFWARDPFAPRLNEQQMAALFEKSMGLPGIVAHEKDPLAEQSNSTGNTMKSSDLKQLGMHPVSLGIVVGALIGGGYLMFSGITDTDSGAPVNLVQVSEDTWNNDPIQPQRQISNEYPLAKIESSEAYEEDMTPEEGGRAMPLANNVPALPVAEIPMQAEPLMPATVASAPVEVVSAVVPEVSKASKPAPKSPAKAELSQEEQHLLSLDKKHYTLQLLGARTEKNVKQFIAQHGIAKQTYTYKTKLSGKDWYVVVYGEYPSKEAAKEAVASIPDSLKTDSLKPWVRDVDSIHKDINRQA